LFKKITGKVCPNALSVLCRLAVGKRFIAFALLVLVSLMTSLPRDASAQTYPVWQGSGTNWNTAANWSLTYQYAQLQWTGGGATTSWANFGTAQGQWRFYFSGGTAYTLGGDQINFSDFGGQRGGILSDSTATQTIGNNLSFQDGGARTMFIFSRNTGGLTFGGTIASGGSVTSLGIGGTSSSSILTFNGAITAGVPIIVGTNAFDDNDANVGNTRAVFAGNNTYTGATTVRSGALTISHSNALGNTSAGTTVNTGAALRLSNNITFASEAITLNGDGLGGTGALVNISGNNTWQGTISNNSGARINSDTGTLTLSGNINSSGNNLYFGGAGNITVGGAIASTLTTGNGALYKDGAGVLTLTNNNTGLTGLVRLLGGTISITNNNSLGSGTLELGGFATQAILLVGTNTSRSQAVLISDASTNSVINVASGSVFTNSGNVTGGGNNATKFGKAGAGTLLLAGTASTYGGQIQIGDGTLIIGSNNGLSTNITTSTRGVDLGLDISDTSTANNVAVLASNGVTVSNSFYVAPNTSSALRTIGISGAGTNTFNNEFFLGGNLTVAAGANATDRVNMSGNILNTGGLIKTNEGILVLSGTNSTFSGGVTLGQGTLRVGNNTALGTGAFTINDGTTFASDSGTARTATNNITLGGNVQFGDATGTGALTLSNINLAQVTRTFTVGNRTTVAGVISNGGVTAAGLTKAGAGTLTLSGTNTYTGATTISAGTLALGAGNVLSDLTAVTINGGTFDLGGRDETVDSINMSSGSLLRGSGALTLANASSFTGGTVTEANIGSRINVAGLLTLGAVTFNYTASGSSNNTAVQLSNNLTTTGSGTALFTNSGGGIPFIHLSSATRTFSVVAGTVLDIGWGLRSGGIVKDGTGTLILRSATSSTNLSSGVTLSNGVLLVGADQALGDGDIILAGGTIASASSTNVNLTIGASKVVTVSGDVTFGQAAGGTGSLTFSSTNTNNLGGATRTLTTVVDTTIAGSLGNGSITKAGTGTLYLSNASSSFSTLTINSGRVAFQTNATITDLTGSGGGLTLAGGALTINPGTNNTTYRDSISGSGSLTKAGANQLILTASNSYSGGTVFQGGITAISNSFALGSGSLSAQSNSTLTALTSVNVSNNISVANGIQLAVTTTQNAGLTNQISGVVSGAGGLRINTAGAMAYLANTNNSFGGGMHVQQGTNAVANLGNAGANSALGTNSTIKLGNTTTTGNLLWLGAVGETSDKVIDLAGTTGGGAIYASGTGLLKITGNMTASGSGAKLLTLNGTGAGELAGALVDSAGGATSLFKSGSGTWTLSGTTTHSGSNSINSGVLALSNGSALADTAIVVLSNASSAMLRVDSSETIGSLRGGGTTGGNVNLNGTGVTLTVAETANNTYAGIISNSGGLTKTGAGTLTLSGVNTYSGLTTISAGTLALATATNILSSSTAVTINGGTFDVGPTNTTLDSINMSSGTLLKGGNSLTLTNASSFTGGTVAISSGSGSGIITTNTLTLGAVTFDYIATSTKNTALSINGNVVTTGSGTTLFRNTNTGSPAINLNNGTRTFDTVDGTTMDVNWGLRSGGLVKDGAGTLILRSTNSATSLSDGVTLSNGVLLVGADTALGNGFIRLAGGTIASASSTNLTFTNTLTNAGDVTFGQVSGGTGSLTFSSTATNNLGGATRTLSTVVDTTIAGALGNGGIAKAGSGTLYLSNASSSFGALDISAGRVDFQTNATITGLSGSGGDLALSGGVLTLNSSTNNSFSQVISGAGGLTKSGAGTITLGGSNTYAGVTTISAGGISVSAASGLGASPGSATTNQLTLNGGRLVATSGFTNDVNSGITVGTSGGTIDVSSGQTLVQQGGLYGTGAFTKTGGGVLHLTNTSGGYAGAVTVTNGTLQVNTTNRGANITLGNTTARSSILKGSGVVGTVTVGDGGEIAPGNSPGTLSVSNSLTFNNGGSYAWEINSISGPAGTTWDLITVDTDVVGNGAGTLSIGTGQFTVYGSAIDGFTFDGSQNYTGDYFQIVKASAFAGAGSLANLSFSGSGLGTGSWTFSTNASGLYLNYTAAGAALIFTNAVAANQGAANLVTNNLAGDFATITNMSGPTVVTISNSAPLTFTNGNNSYTGATVIEQGVLVTTVDSANAANGAFGNASTDVQVGSLSAGNTNDAALLIGAGGVTVGRGITVNGGGTGVRTVGATNSSGVATYSGNILLANPVTLSASNSGGTTLFSGIISGSSDSVTVAGSGIVVLSNANTYAGGTVVNSGATLRLGNASALGATNSGTTNVSGSTLDLNGQTVTATEALSIAGTGAGGTGALVNSSTTAASWAGAVTLTNATTINTTNAAGNITLGGAVGGAGSLTKTGTGTLILSVSNNYSGGTTLSAGTIALGANAGLGSGTLSIGDGTRLAALGGVRTATNSVVVGGDFTMGGLGSAMNLSGPVNLGGATRTITLSNSSTFSGVISNGALAINNNNTGRNFTMTASNTFTGGMTLNGGNLVFSGAGALVNTSSVVMTGINSSAKIDITNISASSFTIGSLASTNTTSTVDLGAKNLIVGGNNASTAYAGDITGTGGSLTKNGTGTLTLSKSSTYTGGTTLNAGALAISNDSALGTGTLTIGGGTIGALGSTRTLSNAVVINGDAVLGLGGGSGASLVLNGNIDLAGATRTITLGNSATAGGVISNGGLTVDSTSTGNSFTITNAATYAGPTTLRGGTLALTGAGSIASSALDLTGSTTNAILDISGVTTSATVGSLAGTNPLSSVVLGSKALAAGGDNTSTSFAGVISGAGVLTKSGTGTMTLTGANTYSGGTLISTGALQGNTTSLQGTITNNSLVIFDQSTSGTYSSALSGSGVLLKTNAGVLTLTGENTLTGGTMIGAGALQIGSGGATGSLAGAITNNGGLVLNRTGALSIAGAISGTGALTNLGTGTATLSGANTYSGGTLISAGALQGDTTSLQGAITNNGLVIFDQSSDGTFASVISGTGALTKTNTGVLTLTDANTYSGGTMIGQGTLSIGNGGTTGSLAGLITNNATLVFNRSDSITQSGIISGTGALNKTGAGTLTLSQANTYTGTTTISNGAIRVTDEAGLGTAAAGSAVVSGAALELENGITVGAESLALSGTGIGNGGALRGISGNNNYNGAITLGAASRINSDAGTLALGGGVTGTGFGLTVGGNGNIAIGTTGINTGAAGALTKDGSGTLTITAAGDYTGATTVSAGVLNIQNATATGTTAGGISVTSGAALQIQGGITVGAEELTLNDSGINTDGALRNISGNNTYGGAITLGSASRINSDADSLTLNGGITGTGLALTIGGAGNTTIGTTGINTGAAGTLTKDGSGTLTITAAGNYTGATTVSAGVLNIQNATATGTAAGGISVTSGAALEMQGGIAVGAEALTLNGSGIGTSGALRNISGNNTYGGTITLGSSGRVNSDAGMLTLSGGITGTQNLTVGGAGDTTISGAIATSTGTLTKDGLGTLLLSSSANTFSGNIAVSAGTLAVTNGGAIAASSLLTVGSGATFSVIGSEGVGRFTGAGTVSIATNQTLTTSFDSASNSFAGSLNGGGSLTKAGSGTFVLSGNNGGYSGETVLNSGALLVGANGAFGTGTVTINYNDGTGSRTLASTDATAYTLNNNFNLYYNAFTLGQESGGTGSLTLGGTGKTFFLGSDGSTTYRNITVNGRHTIAADVTGGANNNIVKSGSGTLALVGANTFSGGIFIDQGAIDLAGGSISAGVIDIGGGSVGSAINASNAALRVSTNGTFGRTISINGETNGSGVSGTRTMEFANNGGTATLSGNIAVEKALTVSVTDSGATGILGGTLSGSGGSEITVAGNGILGLTGTSTTDARWTIGSGATLAIGNSRNLGENPAGYYSTKLTLNGGTLQATNSFSLNSNVGIQVAANSTISVGSGLAMTNPAVMGGTATLTKAGNGTLVLSGANTNSGGLSVTGGALSVSAASQMGTTNNALNLNGGTLLSTASFNLGSGRTVTIGSGGGTLLTASGTQLTFDGTLTGTGTMTKLGAGTLALGQGSGAFTGNTTLGAGVLLLTTNTALANSLVTISNGAVLTNNFSGSTIDIGDLEGSGTVNAGNNSLSVGGTGGSTTFSGTINISGSNNFTSDGAGTLTLSGKVSDTQTGSTIVGAGALQLSGTDNRLSTNAALAVSNGATLDLNGLGQRVAGLSGAGTITNSPITSGRLIVNVASNANTFSGTLQGGMDFEKTGAGTMVLAGNNGFTGEVNVLGGTLSVGADNNLGNAANVVTLSNNTAAVNFSSSFSSSRNFTVATGTTGTLLAGSGVTTTLNGNLSKNGSVLVFGGGGSFTVNGVISGASANSDLVVSNSTVTLNSANTYSGPTYVHTGGTLNVGINDAMPTDTALYLGTNATSGTVNLQGFNQTVASLQTQGSSGTNNVVSLGGGTLTVNGSSSTTYAGLISGSGSVVKSGTGTLSLTAANTYGGPTTISNGALQVSLIADGGTASSIGTGLTVTMAGANATNAVLDYTGGNVTTDRAFVMNEGGGTISIASSTTELTLTGSASGTGKLIVGEGTLVLSNATANSFAPGSIQVDSGATLQLAASDQIGNTTGLILNGGTFRVGTATTGFSDTLGTLTLSASSTIDLGAWTTGVRQLTFANSSAITWTGTLTITNWQGVALQSSDVAEILFGTGGLTTGQLGQVYWANQNINGGTLLGGGGELVPIPEPRVYAAVVALLAVVGWRERKRLLGLVRRKRSSAPIS
jgi:autotransporter-associated beta strand protein